MNRPIKMSRILTIAPFQNSTWTVRRNLAHLVSLIVNQYVSKHSDTTLIPVGQSGHKQKRRKSALFYFDFFGPGSRISETSSQFFMKMRAMLCHIVSKSYSRFFFSSRSATAFRSLQKLTGTKSYHGSSKVKFQFE